ncbi:MAG TPA: efflux transporter outer membrane subunit, partial [Myxococcota bacterium]|nr:efflux transporter outer membrane subunit [Myxococcota bacterium]
MKRIALISLFAIAACKVGPDYDKPKAAEPPSYKEIEGWKVVEPADDADRGDWWAVFADATLDELMRQVEVSNQNLKQAEAAYREARGVLQSAKAGILPALNVNGGVRRTSGAVGTNVGGATVGGGTTGGGPRTIYNASTGITWELDVWGRIRRTIESNAAEAQASAADIASAKLSAQSQLATAYFQLRSRDEQRRLFEVAAEAYGRAYTIAKNQYDAGIATKADVSLAQTQLESAHAQSIGIKVQRARLEHAIAVLVGKPPSEISIAIADMPRSLPEVPITLPSVLLERRPDVAAAERRMAAANAQIGVAIAAYFPTISLTGSLGYQSSVLGSLFDTASLFWSIGPTLAGTVWDWGRRSGQVTVAREQYEQTVAAYRQTALTAMQQVEDQLVGLHLFVEQSQFQQRAVDAAREAERIQTNRYKAGTVD